MQTRESRARARRQIIRRRRQVVGAGLLVFVAVLFLAGFRLAAALTSDSDAKAGNKASQLTTKAESQAGASTMSKSLPAKSLPTKSLTAKSSTRPPSARATGQYVRAPGGTDRQGSGTLRTYRVEVETGTEQDAPAFASAVDATLADPRSWTNDGRWSLQRVASDNADFVIRLATPATVDKVCAAVGLDTAGYVSCRAGKYVMVNRDRWLQAIPDYNGDVALYRRYVINHEVGHQLGYGHQACPGPGRPAPVMQQQTLGLGSCRPNGWPYAVGVLAPAPPAR